MLSLDHNFYYLFIIYFLFCSVCFVYYIIYISFKCIFSITYSLNVNSIGHLMPLFIMLNVFSAIFMSCNSAFKEGNLIYGAIYIILYY